MELINCYKSIADKTNLVSTDAKACNHCSSIFGPYGPSLHGKWSSHGRIRPVKSRHHFEALAALFWVCISKLKGAGDGLIDMSVCSDMRSVLNLDNGFFGNCMVYNRVNSKNLKEHKLPDVAKVIGEVMSEMDNDGITDLIEWLEHNDHQSPPTMNVVGVGHVLVLPSPPGEGPFSRVVMVTLPEEEAVRLCEDDLILNFSPTILMGVNN
ncbi:hypothetical protein OIU78_023509 [Salix suchowensis]|nr:hypothetical protein OIU78_023509 [Salix suchowensis]